MATGASAFTWPPTGFCTTWSDSWWARWSTSASSAVPSTKSLPCSARATTSSAARQLHRRACISSPPSILPNVSPQQRRPRDETGFPAPASARRPVRSGPGCRLRERSGDLGGSRGAASGGSECRAGQVTPDRDRRSCRAGVAFGGFDHRHQPPPGAAADSVGLLLRAAGPATGSAELRYRFRDSCRWNHSHQPACRGRCNADRGDAARRERSPGQATGRRSAG